MKKALESSKNLPSFAQKSVDVDALEARYFKATKLTFNFFKLGPISSMVVLIREL